MPADPSGAGSSDPATNEADDETFAANVLPIGETLVANAAFPRTLARVRAHAERAGLRVCAVDISEFGKAEAGLTCMSLVFAATPSSGDDIAPEGSS